MHSRCTDPKTALYFLSNRSLTSFNAEWSSRMKFAVASVHHCDKCRNVPSDMPVRMVSLVTKVTRLADAPLGGGEDADENHDAVSLRWLAWDEFTPEAPRYLGRWTDLTAGNRVQFVPTDTTIDITDLITSGEIKIILATTVVMMRGTGVRLQDVGLLERPRFLDVRKGIENWPRGMP